MTISDADIRIDVRCQYQYLDVRYQYLDARYRIALDICHLVWATYVVYTQFFDICYPADIYHPAMSSVLDDRWKYRRRISDI